MVLAEIELGAQTVNMIAFLIANCYQLAHKCKYLPGAVIWLELVQCVGVGALLFEKRAKGMKAKERARRP